MTLIAMGSTTVKRARKGADAVRYYIVSDVMSIPVDADGKVITPQKSVTIRVMKQVGSLAPVENYDCYYKTFDVKGESESLFGQYKYTSSFSFTYAEIDGHDAVRIKLYSSKGDLIDTLDIVAQKQGQTGEKASYYEARFVNQDFDVRVDNDHLNGVLYAVFDLRVYHVVGSDATEVSGNGVTVNFSFRDANGTEIKTGTAEYDSTTKLVSFSQKALQSPYFDDEKTKVDRITSCYYSISLPSSMGGSTRDGVIPVQFYAPSAFEHSDTLFKSIFAKGSKFSQLVQNVDGIFTRVQRLETNMLMGTTTGLGWTHEKTCSESSYSFDASLREFTIINYFPAFRDGITSSSTAYSTLKSAVLQVVPGKTYILSFKADVGDKVDFRVELKYGTTNAVSDASRDYYWKDRKAKHDDKAMDVLVPTKGSDGRYFVVFVAKSGYDYMQVMFVNAVDGNNYAVTSSTTSGDSTTINGTWPYSDTKNHTTSSSTTVSKDGAVRTTVSNVHVYTGSSTSYGAFTQTTVETVTPTYLYITEPQLEEATRDDIADIEPSDYKSYQNAVESYIQQLADSIKLYANDIIINAEHKLAIDGDYFTVNTKNFKLTEDGSITATNALLKGTFKTGEGENEITISSNSNNFGEFHLGKYVFIGYNGNGSSSGGDFITTYPSYGGIFAIMSKANIDPYGTNSDGIYYTYIDGMGITAESATIHRAYIARTVFGSDGGTYLTPQIKTELEQNLVTYLFMSNSSQITIPMPSNPENGNMLVVVQQNASINFSTSSDHPFKYGTDTSLSAYSGQKGQYNVFNYFDGYWNCVYYRNRIW